LLNLLRRHHNSEYVPYTIATVPAKTMLSEHVSPFDEALSRPFLDEPTRKKWCVSKSSSWFYSSSESASSSTMAGSEEDDDDYESISFESDDDSNGAPPPLSAGGALQAHCGPGASSCNPFDGYDDELIMANCGESSNSNPVSSCNNDSSPKKSQIILFPTSEHPLALPDTSGSTAPTTAEPDIEEALITKSIHKEILDLELALFREREFELSDIAGSMRQIRDIHQG
jgi:hypothetical protein